jgi:thioredoxin 1
MEEVNWKEGLSLIDFWSPQCGPCMQLSPTIDEIKAQYQNLNVAKININEADNVDVAVEFGVRALPTLIFLKDGVEVDRQVGLRTKEEIEAIIKEKLIA